MSNDTNTEATTQSYEKGSWQDVLATSEAKRRTSEKASKVASKLLWDGAQSAIGDWLTRTDEDEAAEGLASEATEALGGSHRRGDASKIKTVALAVKSSGLVLADYENLSKAYAEAVRLTKTVKQEASEDEAAEGAIASIDAPKSSSTPEGAASILLAAGLDEASRLLVETLGAENHEAHRALLRALSAEVAGRVKAKTKKVEAGPKDGAVETPEGGVKAPAKPKATVKAGKAKPKTKAAPVRAKAEAASEALAEKAEAKAVTPIRRAKPVVRTKAKPIAKPVAKPAPVEETIDDLLDEEI